MIQLYYTYRIYKKFSNPVLGRRKLNQAGFFNLKITNEEVIDSILGGHILISAGCKVLTTLFELCKYSTWTVEERELVANNLVNEDDQGCSLLGIPFLFTKIKGRVERDCLNSKQSILSVILARFGLIEYNVARMGNKQSYTLLRKLNRGLYHTS